MKVKYHINFLCSNNLNSKDNIDYVFEVESPYLPEQGFYLAGIFVKVESSAFDVALNEAIVYGTCFVTRDRAMDEEGIIDVEKAQREALRICAKLSEKYGLHGTYTRRK
ncbi:hypothetical protein [Zhaonella formicivorans]|jgi:hypothetical protein|uniref:hypothetical protein n=1 Tax=Zhaonella formicivorans TaxID=2528593 RepID=UPI0010CE4301|nr:hypothetical protein [Zhaonella formicivorans]